MKGEKLKKEKDSGPKLLLRTVKTGQFFPNKMQSFFHGLKLIFDDALFSVELIGNGFLFFIQDLGDLRKILKKCGEISKSIHNKGNFDSLLSIWKLQIEKNATSLSDSQIFALIENEFKSNGNPSFRINKIKKALKISFPGDILGFEKFTAFKKDFKKKSDGK